MRIFAAVLGLAVITLQACSGDSEFLAPSRKKKTGDSTSGPSTEPTPTPAPALETQPPEETDILKGFTKKPELLDLEPAVIVKQPACVACHAQIKGSFITDFNLTAKPFASRTGLQFDANGVVVPSTITELAGPESLRPLAFRSMNLDGAFVVPNAQIDGGDILTSMQHVGYQGTTVSIAEALRLTQITIDGAEAYESPNISSIAIPTVGANRDKAQSGVNEIRAVTEVVIAPPTEKEIKDLASKAKGELFASGDVKVMKLSDDTALEGFAIKAGKSGPFVMNTAAATCKGDVLVLGTLVFSELGDLNVTGSGCRIYVSQSIFVKGAINAKGGVAQLAAGRAISMGIRDSRPVAVGDDERLNVYDFIEDSGVAFVMRMKGDSSRVVATTPFHWFFSAPDHALAATPEAKAAANERFSKWTDTAIWTHVGEAPASEYCTFEGLHPEADCEYFVRAVETAYGTKRQVSYSGVLLAAPEVHGRYHGKITGVIVARLALFALADFQFEADTRFKDQPVLPALDRRLVELK